MTVKSSLTRSLIFCTPASAQCLSKKGPLTILTNELFHIILPQKSCLERNESTQISIRSRRKSSLISCLVASFSQSYQEKLIFLLILKDRYPKMFSILIYNHRKCTLLSTRSLKETSTLTKSSLQITRINLKNQISLMF